MTRILSLIGVVLVVGCGGPEPRDLETLELVGESFINPQDGEPYSGPVFMMEDRTRLTGSLKDGVPNGKWIEYSYSRDGPLEEMTTYTIMGFEDRDRVRNGPHETYYENGQLEEKRTYKDGVQDGPFERYHDNGQLSTKGTYKDGERDGLFEYYDENGQLRSKRTYKDGELDGPDEGYFEDGQLSGTGTFKNGEFDGPYEIYYDNGQLWTKGIYKDGEKCGEWFENGETVTYDPC